MKNACLLFFLNPLLFSYNSITRGTYSIIENSSGMEGAKKIHFIYNYDYKISEEIIYLSDGCYFKFEREFPNREYGKMDKSKRSFFSSFFHFMKTLNKYIFSKEKIKSKICVGIGNNILNFDCTHKLGEEFTCSKDAKRYSGVDIFKYIDSYFSDNRMKKLLNIVSCDKLNYLSRNIFLYRSYGKENYKFIEKLLLCKEAEGRIGYNCSEWENAEVIENVQTIIIK